MKEKLLNMLAEICEDDIVKSDLDVDLFETGLVDSLVFIELLVQIEETFNVVTSPSEIDRSMVNTPRKLLDYVAARMQK